MFEVGKNYEFHIIIGGDETTMWGTIERCEHPLIKLEDVDELNVFIAAPGGDQVERVADVPAIPGMIINVTSVNFISAQETRR